MEIAVQRFGPIESGSVPIKPLTVFIGPNNSGKSYFAMLAYAAAMAAPPFHEYHVSGAAQSPAGVAFLRNVLSRPVPGAVGGAIADEVLTLVGDGGPVDARLAQASPALVAWLDQAIGSILHEYAVSLVKELERCFGSRLSQLRRRNGDSELTTVRVHHDQPDWAVRIQLTGSRRQFVVEQQPDARLVLEQVVAGLQPALRGRSGERPPAAAMVVELRRQILNACFARMPKARYYLPAARSGILHSHKLLASILVSRAPLAGIEPVAIPRMTGIITDFISLLLQLEPGDRRARFDGIARHLESRILDGEIEIHGNPPAYPEISYRVRDHRFQLHQTSSMVSDLAPVVLFLRYLVGDDELLIVEEPEAHLHPESQLEFARVLARVVNAGATTVLATHSDYFLTQINNCIRASSVPEAGDVPGFAAEERISPAMVGAYLFRPRPGSGTRIRRIPITKRSGFSDREFALVNESLYAEAVDLQRQALNEA
jgi:predicted ATPase